MNMELGRLRLDAGPAGPRARMRMRRRAKASPLSAWERLAAAGLAGCVVALSLALAFPGVWPAELVISLSPQAMAAAGGALALGLMRRRLSIVAPAAAAGWLALLSINDVVEAVPAAMLGDHASTLVWVNVHRDPAAFSRAIDLAIDVGADVLAIGEAPDVLDLEEGQLARARAAFPVDAAPNPAGGVLVLTRHPAVETAATSEGVKRSVRAHIEFPGGAVDVVAAHLPTPMSPAGQFWRGRHMEEALGLVRSGASTIMVGDFNTTPWSPDMRRWLEGVSLERAATDGAATWFSKSPGVGLPIDHAFLSRDVKARVVVGPDVGSDHFPLIVRFEAGAGR